MTQKETRNKEDDFFNVNQYPTAKFEIIKAVNLQNDELANQMIYGNLTIKDQTNQIGFKAKISKEDNLIKVSTPRFNINRTKWGLKYKSKTFSELKDNFINDEIGLLINVVANQKS